MFVRRGFSDKAVQEAALNMRLGVKPLYRVSDKLSDADIERAWREAAIKVFGRSKNICEVG